MKLYIIFDAADAAARVGSQKIYTYMILCE